MNMRKTLLALATASLALGLNACIGDDDDGAPGAITLTQFAIGDITGNTRDDNDPVELNDLFVDTSSENPADYDGLLPTS